MFDGLMKNFVVLMAGENIHGRLLLEKLCIWNLKPALVINETNTDRANRLRTFLKNDFYNPLKFDEMDLEIKNVDSYNSKETLALLHDLQPEYIINGGCGIFGESLLNIATVINVHPGILPYFRGLDPVIWSLYFCEPVGATVHKMSKGIDEGPIYLAKQLSWSFAKDITDLRIQCISWGGELLCDFLSQPEKYPEKAQEVERGQYFSNFPPEKLNVAQENLKFYENFQGGNKFLGRALE